MPAADKPPTRRLSIAEYQNVERVLDDWKQQMMVEARSHPDKSYNLGAEQVTQFVQMAGDLPHGAELFGGEAPTKVNALKWLQTYTLHEFEGAVDRYADQLRSAILYGTQQAVNPSQTASWIYHATHEAEINWRMIARTEMIRANHQGRLDACAKMGYKQVWVPPHVGSCSACKRLIENKVFDIDAFRGGTNYGKRSQDWIPCIPLHPQCRHVAVAYIPEVYERMQEQYRAAQDIGLDDKALDEMFESSGQLKAEYKDDPRIAQWEAASYKTMDHDPYAIMLGEAVAKVSATFAVTKGYFDNPEPGLDPLVWEGTELKRDVRQHILDWWHHTLGADAGDWSSIYLSGSICTYMWIEKKNIGDIDLQIVVSFDRLRTAHPEYAKLTEDELHAALVTQVKLGLDGYEAAPGLPLDAFIRPEGASTQFAYDVRASNQPAFDIGANAWIAKPLPVPYSEDVVNENILEGLGGEFAIKHPEWVQVASRFVGELEDTLREYNGAATSDVAAAKAAELQAAYTTLHDLREHGYDSAIGTYSVGNFIWQYAHQYGPLVEVKRILEEPVLGKVLPHATIAKPSRWHVFKRAELTHAAVGTEHWITIHPNGEDEKGTPVLVRENGDGTASIIGGAGHHLDHVRIGEKGRIDRKGAAKPPRQYDPGEVTEDMADKAREGKATAQNLLREAQTRLAGHVQRLVEERGALVAGQPVKWDALSSAEQADLVKRATHDSLYQSTYGQFQDSQRAEAPVGPIVVTPAPRDKDESPEPSEPKDTDEPTEDEPDDSETPEREPVRRPRLALSTADADSIYEEIATSSALRRRVREANKILTGETRPEDSAGLDWSPIDAPAEAQRKAAGEALTQINRELLNDVEEQRKRSNSLVSQSIQRGCFDAFDSLSYGVFGKTILPTRLQALLGVNGTAQIMAHELQAAADRGDLDLDKVKSTIDDITDERQSSIMRLDLNRARFAAREAAAMGEEMKASAAGDSMFTITSSRSRQVKKMREAAQSLGMAVSGSEALHTLQTMIGKKIDTVSVEGFGSKALINELAHKAGVHVTPSMIEREGAGRYNLKLSAHQIAKLLQPSEGHDPNADLLHHIRTGEDMDAAIEQASHPPGYSRTLDRAQAQGSLFLRAAGSGVLAFAPGVGKTDTAIGAALELMAKKPGTRVLIVAPATAVAGTWAKTIQQTAPGKSMTVLGRKGPGEGEDASSFDWEQATQIGGKQRAAQTETPGDFNIIGFDTLRANPELVKNLGHTIVITDEAQYAKNENTKRYAGMMAAVDSGGVTNRWALTGTPLEKNMGELHTLLNWAKPGHYGSKQAFGDRYGQLNQFESLTGNERVQQFRDSCADGMFLQAPNMSAMPPFPDLEWVDAPISEGHKGAIHQAVQEYNAAWQERHRQRLSGVPSEDLPKLPPIGGYSAQQAALMKPQSRGYQGPNERVNKIADMIEGQKPTVWEGFKDSHDHADGDNAGTYAPKAIIFGKETQPLQPIKDELTRRGGRKVFYTQGGDAKANDTVIRKFIAEKGAAVLITSDTNKTARSFQFGDNSGKFQHGATQTIHADMPQNNADLQQRIARSWRRGSQVPVQNRILYSDTPQERNGRDSLASELRLQQAVGNPEDKVLNQDESGKLVGRQTIQQKLEAKGQETVARPEEEETGKTFVGRMIRKATELRIPKGGESHERIHPGEWTRAGAREMAQRKATGNAEAKATSDANQAKYGQGYDPFAEPDEHGHYEGWKPETAAKPTHVFGVEDGSEDPADFKGTPEYAAAHKDAGVILAHAVAQAKLDEAKASIGPDGKPSPEFAKKLAFRTATETWVHCYPYNPERGHVGKAPRAGKHGLVSRDFEEEIRRVSRDGLAPRKTTAAQRYDVGGTDRSDLQSGIDQAHVFMEEAQQHAKPSGVKLFRGVAVSVEDIDKLFKAGQRVGVPISSWSSSEDISESFSSDWGSSKHGKQDRPVLLVVPKGTLAYKLDSAGNYGEKEHVLAGEFQVTRVEQVDPQQPSLPTYVYLGDWSKADAEAKAAEEERRLARLAAKAAKEAQANSPAGKAEKAQQQALKANAAALTKLDAQIALARDRAALAPGERYVGAAAGRQPTEALYTAMHPKEKWDFAQVDAYNAKHPGGGTVGGLNAYTKKHPYIHKPLTPAQELLVEQHRQATMPTAKLVGYMLDTPLKQKAAKANAVFHSEQAAKLKQAVADYNKGVADLLSKQSAKTPEYGKAKDPDAKAHPYVHKPLTPAQEQLLAEVSELYHSKHGEPLPEDND